jgi:hypothetical protein
MSLKFTYEDFNRKGAARDSFTAEIIRLCAVRAQELFDRWLASQPVVTTVGEPDDRAEFWCKHKATNAKWQARLVDIQPLSKCEHPAEKVKTIYGGTACLDADSGEYGISKDRFECECGAKVKPSAYTEVGK